MAFSMKSSITRSSMARTTPSRGAVRVQAADRPMWYPGNPSPAHLDGSLPGDYGFDPLNLGSDPEVLKWMQQAELQHCRWAMVGTAGILYTAVAAQGGQDIPQWYDAGEVANAKSAIPFGTLFITQMILQGWAESKRLMDMRVPGSQGDGSFFGITDDFKGKEVGYPGGRYFDPLGLAGGDATKYAEFKVKEVKNGRLAMVAMVGFWAQHAATGAGPIENLVAHVSDPTHVTYATNGISVPFLSS
eukprot:gene30899-35952_t